jgi:hypothetical protein
MLARTLAQALHEKGYRTLIAWVLAKNPSLPFYSRMGGAQVSTKRIQIGGAELTELALGWSDIAGIQ